MKVIAKKSTSIAILYIICLIFGVAFIALGALDYSFLLMGVVIFPFSLYIIIDFYRIPPTPIILNEQDDLLLPKGIVLKLSEIEDVSYRRASARGFQYKFGTIIIISTKGKFKFRYISNCEEVSKTITKLIYENKALE